MDEDNQNIKPERNEFLHQYLKIGVLSFGGPAAQIALMHRIFVDEKKWISDRQFLSALNFCMLLPGPEAMQLATYIGWRVKSTVGGIVAGILFVMPGALLIALLALLYVYYGSNIWIEALFSGVKSAVIVIVIEALFRLSKKALKKKASWIIAALSFISIFGLQIAYPIIIIAAALFGFIYTNPVSEKEVSTPDTITSVPVSTTLRTILLWLAIWFVPLALIGLITDHGFLYDIGVFFSKLATMTFGGAYAVLAYMTQDVVSDLNWLSAQQMIDGLGLAETTPGPLILVTEFVGFVAGFNHSGPDVAFASALITLWVTFIPCFMWIFVGAPYIDWISSQPRLRSALSSVMAAVVGVILNLSLWFGLHVIFETLDRVEFGILTLLYPDLSTINSGAFLIAIISYYLLIIKHLNILFVLSICSLSGVLIKMIF